MKSALLSVLPVHFVMVAVASQQFSRVAAVPAARVWSVLAVYPEVHTSVAHVWASQHAVVRASSASVEAESMLDGLALGS